ncbi:MAG TPA: inositol monophosphatase family protein [Actinomycetota bacterium]|nr:inositol monophosphatase family protein [Actinomycetota bacterium]
MREELLEIALEAAEAAGRLLTERFEGPASGVTTKSSPTDLVSDADRAAEELIVGHLRKHRPNDGILAEEGGRVDVDSGITWVIDPLDGTVNYLFDIPVWAVSIAARDATGNVAGVIHDPNRDETFAATCGGGATLNGVAIRVSDKTTLDDALIGTGFSYEADIRRVQAEVLARVLPLVRDIRRAGSAALDLASLSCGRLDGFYEATMGEWDKAAGVLIATEAGARITELRNPRGVDNGVVAANPELHPKLAALVDREET